MLGCWILCWWNQLGHCLMPGWACQCASDILSLLFCQYFLSICSHLSICSLFYLIFSLLFFASSLMLCSFRANCLLSSNGNWNWPAVTHSGVSTDSQVMVISFAGSLDPWLAWQLHSIRPANSFAPLILSQFGGSTDCPASLIQFILFFNQFSLILVEPIGRCLHQSCFGW